MNKLRLLLLFIMLSLLFYSGSITSKAEKANRTESDIDEISINGQVKVRGTPSGHLTITVDKSFPMEGLQPDGMADILFHFVPKKTKRVYRTIALDLEHATVAYTDKRLTILSIDRQIVLNLMLDRAKKSNNEFLYYTDRSRDIEETIRIHRGKALTRYLTPRQGAEGFWLCGAEGGKCSFRENLAGVAPNSEGAPNCSSGGVGSSSCSISCGSGTGCSTGCESGFYACCHCTEGCHCIKNSDEQ